MHLLMADPAPSLPPTAQSAVKWFQYCGTTTLFRVTICAIKAIPDAGISGIASLDFLNKMFLEQLILHYFHKYFCRHLISVVEFY